MQSVHMFVISCRPLRFSQEAQNGINIHLLSLSASQIWGLEMSVGWTAICFSLLKVVSSQQVDRGQVNVCEEEALKKNQPKKKQQPVILLGITIRWFVVFVLSAGRIKCKSPFQTYTPLC